MRKTKLPARELEICQRLREARELCELNQAACARQLGIERSTLLNYEHNRTPLRFDTALRFCRQFIISEEWLATGRYDACHAEASRLKINLGPGIEEMDTMIFKRQCVDLFSEPVALHIPPGMLFSEAYDKFLAPVYARLIGKSFYLPRIVVTDSDDQLLALNLLGAINKRFVILLNNEARRRGQKPSSAWRVYSRCMLDAANLVFQKMMGFPLHLERLHFLDWIRASVTDPDFKIPFLEEYQNMPPADSQKNILPSITQKGKTDAVRSELEKLIARVKRAAAHPGAKAELARILDVAPARITEWLTDDREVKREPGGYYTLELLKWVEQEECKK